MCRHKDAADKGEDKVLPPGRPSYLSPTAEAKLKEIADKLAYQQNSSPEGRAWLANQMRELMKEERLASGGGTWEVEMPSKTCIDNTIKRLFPVIVAQPTSQIQRRLEVN